MPKIVYKRWEPINMVKNYKTIFKIKCKNREIKQMQEHQSVQVYLKDLTANLQPNQTFLDCKQDPAKAQRT